MPFFFRGQFYSWPFFNFILFQQNNKRMRPKSETSRFLRLMCEVADAMLVVFSGLNLAVVYLDSCVREDL